MALLLDSKPALGAVLQHGVPLEVGNERLVLAFPPGSFFGRQAESADGQRAIAATAARVLGATPAVQIVYADVDAGAGKTLAQEEAERRDARLSATRERALGHPLVLEVAQIFDLPRERMTVRVELE